MGRHQLPHRLVVGRAPGRVRLSARQCGYRAADRPDRRAGLSRISGQHRSGRPPRRAACFGCV